MVTGTELTHVVYAAPPASRHGRKSQVAGPDGPAGASLLVLACRGGARRYYWAVILPSALSNPGTPSPKGGGGTGMQDFHTYWVAG